MDTNSDMHLAHVNSDVLGSQQRSALSIGALEAELLRAFPAQEAEQWDRTGILVGDPAMPVSGVAVALDATVDAVRVATDLGANVLLSHHPAFLDSLDRVVPESADPLGNCAVVWEAIRSGVTLMNFHTALDVSPRAAAVLPSMLGLKFERIVSPIEGALDKGYGQLCSVPGGEDRLTLARLAARCLSVFGRIPRVWGDPDAVIGSVVTATGSASDLARVCAAGNYDCLVCGEVRYHSALDASRAGLCIIELGHDVSELPLCAVLAQAVVHAGVPEESVRIVAQGNNWWTPESTRR